MALLIPSFPNPFNPSVPLQNAYAWIAGIAIDASTGAGRAVFNIHPTEHAWQASPIDQVSIAFGETLVHSDPEASPPVEDVKFLTLAEWMTTPAAVGKTAYESLGAALYVSALNHPKFLGATVV